MAVIMFMLVDAIVDEKGRKCFNSSYFKIYQYIYLSMNCIVEPNKIKKLSAKQYLKSKEGRDHYECGICYEVCLKPVRCKGKCSKIFCIKCVSDSRQQHDICPYKCSSPFLVKRQPDIELQFHCPYDPSECKFQIKSLEKFNHHHKQCQFVSNQEKHLKKLQQDYKCLKGHLLQFFTGTYEEMTQSICYQCKEKLLCRSFCRICQHFYCVQCRALPCAKKGCPIGHNLNFQKIANLNYICDMCGVSTSVNNDGVYDDSVCNFGLCQGCYSQLPQDFDKSKPLSLIANINGYCSCGGKLKYRDSIHKAHTCTLCKKFKQCPKICSVKNCKKMYCLSCKLMEVYLDNTCELQHAMTLQKVSEFGSVEQYSIKQQQFGCMKCGQSRNEYYYDKICKTRLCVQCHKYCKRVSIDKQRPILTKCDNNHILMYVIGEYDYYDKCHSCHRQKIIKLQCRCCDQNQVITYCFQCRPIHLETCHFKHPLKFITFQERRECQFCTKNFNQFYTCKKCYFYVCKGCYDKNHEHYNALDKMSEPKPNGQLKIESIETLELNDYQEDSMDVQTD